MHRTLMRRSFHLASTLFFGVLFLPFPRFAFETHTQAATEIASKDTSNPPIVLAQKISIPRVPNPGKINERLFRGAQPAAGGLEQLKQLGVTTIVNLRGWQSAVSSERKKAEVLGLRFINIPVSGWSPPSDEQVGQFLSLFRDSPQEKIFVHCKFGDDRTGVMIAAYRIAENHWTAEQAIQEMHSFGFHNHWHPSMKSYVRQFPSKFAADPVFASLRAAPKEK